MITYVGWVIKIRLHKIARTPEAEMLLYQQGFIPCGDNWFKECKTFGEGKFLRRTLKHLIIKQNPHRYCHKTVNKDDTIYHSEVWYSKMTYRWWLHD